MVAGRLTEKKGEIVPSKKALKNAGIKNYKQVPFRAFRRRAAEGGDSAFRACKARDRHCRRAYGKPGQKDGRLGRGDAHKLQREVWQDADSCHPQS